MYKIQFNPELMQEAMCLVRQWIEANKDVTWDDVVQAEKTEVWYKGWLQGILIGRAYGYLEAIDMLNQWKPDVTVAIAEENEQSQT